MRLIVCVFVVVFFCPSFTNSYRFRTTPMKISLRSPSFLLSSSYNTNTDISNSLPPVATRVPIGSAPQFAIEGDSTEETTSQRLIFAAHWTLSLIALLRASTHISLSDPSQLAVLTALIGASIVIGDFATGVFHWAVDNYGSLKTPIFGAVCAAFQGHHVTPWTITFRSFVNNVYKICFATVPFLFLLAAFPPSPLATIFLTLFINWWMISQELHKYAHMRVVPAGIKRLQDWGVILPRKEHGLHHTAPFEGHYCILTGVCNKALDDSKFFRKLENVVFRLTGNKPNTWKESPEVEMEAMKIFSN